MDENPLWRLRDHGQSVWLSYLRRRLLDGGDLQHLIEARALSGIESDLEFLCGALARGNEYGASLRRPMDEGVDVDTIGEHLLAEEARAAAEVLTPLYEQSSGREGFVSIDVVSGRPDDPQSTSAAIHRAVGLIEHPNIMFKVLATDSGFAVLEAMTAEGYHIHVGPLFSVPSVRQAVRAFAGGLRRRTEAGGAADVTSAISFGLAPLDIAVDDLLGDLIRDSAHDTSREESLVGSIAVATAKVVCREQRELLQRELGSEVAAPSSPLQRIIWTNTATKNPRFGEFHYIEDLVGPDSGLSLSRSSLEAFHQRGVVAATLGRSVDEATEILAELADVGIDLEDLGRRLEQRANDKLAAARDRFVSTVGRACEALGANEPTASRVTLGGGRWWGAVEEIPAELLPVEVLDDLEELVPRLWCKDPSLWSDEPAEQELIYNRLGWIDLIEPMSFESLPAGRFASRMVDADIEDIVVLGMGGSSLCAEVFRDVFGIDNVWVLASTIPRVVKRIAEHVDPARTLVVVSSKSGTTLETRVLADYFYFYALATPMLETAGERFVAVTDPGTPLEQAAHERDFQGLWLTPPDVGGRFSAFTHFGVLPMALMELDAGAILESAQRMAASCAAEVPVSLNPAALLGVALHEGFRTGRDKLTFLCDEGLAPFAAWAEQLVAESLGKDGVGLVPIVGEPAGDSGDYGDDRLFVGMELGPEPDARLQRLLDQLAPDHPVMRFHLDDRNEIGAELFRWQLGTAVAGALLEINPFDEPDVEASKQRTIEILDAAGDASAAAPAPVDVGDGWAVFADLERDAELAARHEGEGLASWLNAHLGRAAVPDYVGLQIFLAADSETRDKLDDIRWILRERLGVATSLGWGPGYLHSTGQLHKGGPDIGVFLLATATDPEDLECPGFDYSFGRLARAQALGDLRALQERGRRVLHLHLDDPDQGLDKLADALERALA